MEKEWKLRSFSRLSPSPFGLPKADALSANVVEAALASLNSIFGRVPEPDEVLVQDWKRDRWARGAYSYVRVNGEGARHLLAQTLDETLYFAGEATNLEGESGTVGGALQSGQRAARELLGA